MYENINSYKPFVHEKVESKNQIIQLAREQDKTKVEGVLAATMIYANLVDYLCADLLFHLRKMNSVATYKVFGAVMFFDPSKERTNLSLGEVKKGLSCFGFPDKESFLSEVGKFAKLRNKSMHSLMHADLGENTEKFLQNLSKIAEGAESILAKYNAITAGLAEIWYRVYPENRDSA